MQVRNPSALDDTYVADAPRAALETMLEGDDLAQLWSGVESNKSKRCMWAPDPRSRTDVKGTPSSLSAVSESCCLNSF